MAANTIHEAILTGFNKAQEDFMKSGLKSLSEIEHIGFQLRDFFAHKVMIFSMKQKLTNDQDFALIQFFESIFKDIPAVPSKRGKK